MMQVKNICIAGGQDVKSIMTCSLSWQSLSTLEKKSFEDAED